jgi:hypothetical protein
MSAATPDLPHADQTSYCMGTFLQHVSREPQPVPPDGCITADRGILCAYPVPDLGPVLDPKLWCWRQTTRRIAPFVASQLYIYVFLKELCLAFHFWVYVPSGPGARPKNSTHQELLTAFVSGALTKANIQHSVPEQAWRDLMKRMSEAMVDKFSKRSLETRAKVLDCLV